MIPSDLVDAVVNRRAVLFAGAGISMPALGMGGIELRNQLGELIKRDYPTYDYSLRSLEDVCDEYAVITDRNRLVYKLADLLPQNRPPTPAHLAAVKAFRFIITTNWDDLFESAYAQIGKRKQILMREDDAPGFSYDQANLLKIHGSALSPLSLVATSDDYEAYPDTHPMLLNHVASLIEVQTVVFVGYGLRDEHLRRLLSRIRRQRGQWRARHYVVGFYDDVRVKVLEGRGMSVIQTTADDFTAELMARAPLDETQTMDR